MNHIKKNWERYLEEVLPSDAPLIQLIETRRAFYSGAASLFTMMVDQTKQAGITEEQGIDYLAELNAEIVQFGIDLLDGRV